MKQTILFLSLALLLCACDKKSDRRSDSEPTPTSTTITFVNASDYYTIVYWDGKKIFGLLKGEQEDYTITDCTKTYYTKITYHQTIAGSQVKYRDLSVKYNSAYTYKVIIKNDNATSYPTKK